MLTKDIVAIETNDGFYINGNINQPHYCRGGTGLEDLIINNGNCKISFHPEWLFIPDKLTSLQKRRSSTRINIRYELENKKLVTDKIPLIILKHEVESYRDVSDDFDVWSGKHEGLRSLYVEKWDDKPGELIDIPFNFQVVLKVDKIKEHAPLSYKVQKTEWFADGFTTVTEKNIQYNLISEIMFPAPLIPDTECKLSSKDTFNIIRQHVNDNINSAVAVVTSDYDFCFTVKKKIRFEEPKKYTVDVNNDIFSKRKRKPKYETRFQTDRAVEVFEMTHKDKNYQGYTPIDGFIGKNQTDLKEKIDFYLECLMEFINTPLVNCSKCKGLGVIVDKQSEEARREMK